MPCSVHKYLVNPRSPSYGQFSAEFYAHSHAATKSVDRKTYDYKKYTDRTARVCVCLWGLLCSTYVAPPFASEIPHNHWSGGEISLHTVNIHLGLGWRQINVLQILWIYAVNMTFVIKMSELKGATILERTCRTFERCGMCVLKPCSW